MFTNFSRYRGRGPHIVLANSYHRLPGSAVSAPGDLGIGAIQTHGGATVPPLVSEVGIYITDGDL